MKMAHSMACRECDRVHELKAVPIGWVARCVRCVAEAIGRGSMPGIFVVTIQVALVHLGALATIEAGAGALFFAAVVVVTMFAAEAFDPRLIRDDVEDAHERAD